MDLNNQWTSLYTRLEVPGDGDCFFSSVNLIMRRLDSNWAYNNTSLRQLSLTQLEQDVSSFYQPCIPTPGLNSNLPQIWASTKAKYQYSGQYADHDLMMATAKALNIDIQIHGGATSLLQVDGRTPYLLFISFTLDYKQIRMEGTTMILYFLKFPR